METIEPYRIESKYFDRLYGDRSKEARFYSELASNYGKRVLELGVGTAALAIPLASEGYQVVGIDNSPDMLAVAEGKLSECDQSVRGRLRLIKEDMRNFDLGEKDFDFAFIAFNTFLHLLNHEEEINCLHRIHEHLRPKGGLAIDVFQLDPRRLPDYIRLSSRVFVHDFGAIPGDGRDDAPGIKATIEHARTKGIRRVRLEASVYEFKALPSWEHAESPDRTCYLPLNDLNPDNTVDSIK